MSQIQADKELLKRLIVLAGMVKVELSKYFIKEAFEYPIDSLLFAIATGVIGRDEKAFTIYYRIKLEQKNRRLNTVAEYLSQTDLNALKDILERCVGGLPEWFTDALKGLIDLNQKYELDCKKDLSDIDPDEFYKDFKDIRGVGERVSLWGTCELCRIWNLKAPSDLRLPPDTREKLEKLGLSENDFDVKELPYIDAVLYEL